MWPQEECRQQISFFCFKNLIVFATLPHYGYWFSLATRIMYGNAVIGALAVLQASSFDSCSVTPEMWSLRTGSLVPKTCDFSSRCLFAATAATIVSGLVCERINQAPFVVVPLVSVVGLLSYHGRIVLVEMVVWLSEMGSLDLPAPRLFTPLVAWAGLGRARSFLGPPLFLSGKFVNGSSKPSGPAWTQHGHCLTLGCLILWIGLVRLQPGCRSVGDDSDSVPLRVAVTTTLGAAGGAIPNPGAQNSRRQT